MSQSFDGSRNEEMMIFCGWSQCFDVVGFAVEGRQAHRKPVPVILEGSVGKLALPSKNKTRLTKQKEYLCIVQPL